MQGIGDILAWSFPLLRTRRLVVRMSWLLPVWVLLDVIRFARGGDWILVGAALVTFPLAMLVHALAHVAAARATGGSASTTTLSLLVDQTDFSLPLRPWSHLLTGIAGPAVNLLMMGMALVGARLLGDPHGILGYVAWINGVIGVANLLACGPFDGQRWWRGLLWLFLPMATAVRVAIVLGFISAIALIVLGAMWTDFLLLFMGIIALLGVIADRQAVQSGVDPVFGVDPSYAGRAPASNWSRRREERRQERLAQEESDEQEVLDRLLEKVSANGLPSLTSAERKQLQRISKRQKQRAAGG